MISPEHSGIVEKDFLNFDSVNSSSNASFDYKNKEATFRIHINNNATDLTELGNFIVQDIMPNDWVMIPIGEEPFLLYEGEKGVDKSVRATKYVSKEEYQDFLTYTENNNIINFNFSKIDKPYLIILKGKPKEEKTLQYFNTIGQSFTEQNNALLYNKNLEAPKKGNGKLTDWEDFRFNSNLLNKTLDISSKENGYLTWNIEYKPYELERPGIRLRDKIPYGIELLRDKNWDIIYGGEKGIVLQEMTLNTNGSYSLGNLIEDVRNYVVYDENERYLILNFPDSTKGYKLTYRTEIVGKPGEITNEVKLEGTDINLPQREAKYIISEHDVSGSIKRGVRFFVIVKDVKGNLIKNSEVTLFSENGKVVRKDITDDEGKICFTGVPEGNYILKQTDVSNNYVLNENDINIKVAKDSNSGKMSIFIDNELVSSKSVEITNESLDNVGNLKVIKKVINSNFDIDENKTFEFTLFLSDKNSYHYKIYDNLELIKEGTIKNNDKFLLKNNQYILIENIPQNTTYNILEKAYSDYNTECENNNSVILANKTINCTFTNKYVPSSNIEITTETPTEISTEMPIETPTEMPIEMSTEISTEMPMEMSTEMSIEMSTEMPMEMNNIKKYGAVENINNVDDINIKTEKDKNGNIIERLPEVKGFEYNNLKSKKDGKDNNNYDVNVYKTGDSFRIKFYLNNILLLIILLIIFITYKRKKF